MSDKSMLSAAKATLQEKRAAAENIAAGFKVDEKGNFELSTKQYGDYTSAVKEANEAKAFIDSIEQLEAHGAYLDGTEEKSEAAMNLAGNRNDVNEGKTLADVFMEGKDFQAAKEAGNFRNVPRLVGELEGKSLHSLTGGAVTHQTLGTAEHRGITERQMRKTRIRDLFPKSSTKASILYGVQETGWVNNAKQVRQRTRADGSPLTYEEYADGTFEGAGDLPTDQWGRKPKSTIQMRPVTWPVATIAHTLDTHRNILSDEPRLRTFLNHRMAEGVKYVEDFDLLHSVGDNSEEITGLFNVQGVQRYTGEATDKKSVQIRRAITMAQLAEYDPTGIVLSPEMWEQVEVEEDGQGGFRVAVNVSVGAVKQVWHLDVVSTTAMSDSQFLIGSFGLGAQIHDRESVSVQMFEQNRDNVETNLVTFRAEERLALEVPRPESFVVGTWDNTL